MVIWKQEHFYKCVDIHQTTSCCTRPLVPHSDALWGSFTQSSKPAAPKAIPHVSWLCNTPQGSTSDGDSCRAQPQAQGRPASIFTHLPYALSSWHGILFLQCSFPAPNLPVPPLPHHDHMAEHRHAARAEEIFLNTRKQASTILPGKHCPPHPPSLAAPHSGPDQVRWCPRETSQTPPAPPNGAGSSPSQEGCRSPLLTSPAASSSLERCPPASKAPVSSWSPRHAQRGHPLSSVTRPRPSSISWSAFNSCRDLKSSVQPLQFKESYMKMSYSI